jgi:hypothetical protein
MYIIPTIIILIGIIFIVNQYYKTYKDLKSGELIPSIDYNNYFSLKDDLATLVRFIKRRVVKSFVYVYEYVLHLLVRSIYLIRNASDDMYTKSRDAFFRKALKNKKSVSRFWPHLKEYKKEIDQEKSSE